MPQSRERDIAVHGVLAASDRSDLHIPRGAYLQRTVEREGGKRAARVRSVFERVSGIVPPGEFHSEVIAVGKQPSGFGSTLTWAGTEDLAVVAFVSAADEYGIGVAGATDGDSIQFYSATGTATFSDESANGHVSSIVTIVAAGAALTAAAFGSPEIAPFIYTAAGAMNQRFATGVNPGKPRDAYGMVPGTRKFARQDGGILVCSPAVEGTWQSGGDDARERWISSSDDRRDDHRPKHVRNAFFLQRGMGARQLVGDGELIVTPWDFAFANNIGVYCLSFILRRKNSVGR